MLFSDRMTACAKPPASASASDSAAPLESSPTPAIVETKKPTSPAKPDNSVSQTAASPAEEAAIAAAEAAEADPSPPADSDSFAYPNSANLGGKGKAGVALLVIGGIVSLVYAVILLIKAFEVSVWWGLGSFFVPFVQLIFVILHWELTQKPFLRSLLAIPIMLAGGLLLMFSLK